MTVDAADCTAILDVIDVTRTAASLALESADGRPLAVRVVVKCSEPLSIQLAANPERFCADLRGQVEGDVWIEKIKLEVVRAPTNEAAPLNEDATSELLAVLEGLRSRPDDAQAVLLSGDCGKLISRLPPEVRETIEKASDDVFTRATALLQSPAAGDSR